MAKKVEKKVEKKRTHVVVDTSAIMLERGTPIPKMLKESKYPWAALLDGEPNELNFFIPMDAEEAARLRTSIQTSGRAYYANRGIARRAVVRVVKGGLAAWAAAE